MKDLISVIIPVYNTEMYLRQCIESVINQTHTNLEIILIDDGSTDASSEICDEYAMGDNRITVSHQKNRGESATRNEGLKRATGQFVAFVDCDDWIEPQMYEMLLNEFKSHEVDLVASSWSSDTDEESQPIFNNEIVPENIAFSRDDLMYYIYKRDSFRSFAYMWNKLYKRTLFFNSEGEMLMFDESLKLGGDVLMLGQLALNVRSALFLNQVYYHYRQRGDSGCHSENISKRKDWLTAYIKLIDCFKHNNIKNDIIMYVERFLVYHCILLAEICIKQRDEIGLIYCQQLAEKFKHSYIEKNQDYPERLEWLYKNLYRN